MARTVGIFRWSQKQGAMARRERHDAIAAYVASKGVWPKPVEMIMVEGGERLLEPGGTLGPILQTVSASDHVVISGFDDLSTSPSELLAGTAALIGTGADVHILEIAGPLDAAMPVLRISWQHGAEIEAELAAERQHAIERDTQWAETFADYQRSTARALASRLGAEAFPELALPDKVMLALPQANGHDTTEPDYTPLGAYLKQRREAAGMTQAHLAERLGSDASRVSRMESSGRGAHIVRAFEILAPEALPSADLQAQIGVPDWFLLAWARPRLTQETAANA